MKTARSWYVDLLCVHCGLRVTGKSQDAFYVQPVDARGRSLEPWAAHGLCKRKPK